MNKILGMLIVALLLCGCMSTQKANDAFSVRYKNVKGVAPSQHFTISNAVAGGKVAETRKIKSTVIPALFYWKFSKTYHTQLHAMVPLNLFAKYADDYARTKNLQDELGNRKLELDIVEIPSALHSTFTNQTIFLIFAAAYSSTNAANLVSTDLRVRYKLLDGEKLIEEGAIEVTLQDLARYSTQLEVSKKAKMDPKMFINSYLDTYENVIYLQSKVFVDKLMQKI